ncbi:MAG TPA: DUF2007 domain-containing protein [Nitrococcus sp.]|nr:DUF2007 domain-containing protein [Nitrococcus sp.]
MRRVYTSSDLLIVGHLAEVLRCRNINRLVRNLYLIGGAGELPPTAIWPELWVDDEDYELARRLVDEVLGTTSSPGPAWVCAGCGECIEGQFAACWNCAALAPPEV